MQAMIEATAVYGGDSFQGTEGRKIQEYVVQLREPLEGHNEVVTYSQKLVEQLQGGPQVVEWERKSNDYKGEYIKVTAAKAGLGAEFRGQPVVPGGGQATPMSANPPARDRFHAAPETVAMKLTELSLSYGHPIEAVVETYNTILKSIE